MPLYSESGYLNQIKIDGGDYICLPNGFTAGSEQHSLRMLTVITGKNGTGKSTLLESILYAFEQQGSVVDLTFSQATLGQNIQIASLTNTDNLKSLRSGADQKSEKQVERENTTILADLKRYTLSKRLAGSDCSVKFPQHQVNYDKAIEVASRLFNQLDPVNQTMTAFESLLTNQFEIFRLTSLVERNNPGTVLKNIFKREFFSKMSGASCAEEELNKLAEKVFNTINLYLTSKGFKYHLHKDSLHKQGSNSCIGDIKFQLPKDVTVGLSRSGFGMGNLSPGERILLLVTLWQYENRSSRPGIIIVDEPDAHLHPVAIQELMSVIKEKLIGEFGLQVIMTSHNPITVTYVPTECLFLLKNDPPHRYADVSLLPVSNKQYAISVLSEGLVYVNEPFAVMLVEGMGDEIFYKAVVNRLYALDRISAQVLFKVVGNGGELGSSCSSAVESFVNSISGEIGKANPMAQFMFGLIDGDNNFKEDSANLKRLKRHSVENYIFDPINLFLCLQKIYFFDQAVIDDMEPTNKAQVEKCKSGIVKLIGDVLLKTDLSKVGQDKLQEVHDKIFECVKEVLGKLLKNLDDYYDVMMKLLKGYIEELKKLEDEITEALIQDFVKNVVARIDSINAVLKEYIEKIKEKFLQELEAGDFCDLFGLSGTINFYQDSEDERISIDQLKEKFKKLDGAREKEVQEAGDMDKQAEVRKRFTEEKRKETRSYLIGFFQKRVDLLEKRESYNVFKNAITKVGGLISEGGEIIDDSQSTDVIVASNNSSSEMTISYQRLLLYCRGHHLQTFYEKIFNIPAELANSFNALLGSLDFMLIPADLVTIFKTLNNSVHEIPDFSSEKNDISSLTDLSFFRSATKSKKPQVPQASSSADNSSSSSEEESEGVFDLDSMMYDDIQPEGDDIPQDVLDESRKLAEKDKKIGPRNIPGWILQDVEDRGNCFYDAVVHQMQGLGLQHLLPVPNGMLPRDVLRLRVQGEQFRDQEWADDATIDAFVSAFSVILAVVNTTNPESGFTYYFHDVSDGSVTNVAPTDNMPLPNLPIIRLAATGNHFLSVIQTADESFQVMLRSSQIAQSSSTFFGRLHEEFLIEHRHDDARSQRAYDERYGIVSL